MKQCFGVARPHQAVRRTVTETIGYRQLMCESRTAYTPGADGVIPSGIGNSSRTVRWVDIAVLIKKFLSNNDIACPRRRVFDDDHPLA